MSRKGSSGLSGGGAGNLHVGSDLTNYAMLSLPVGSVVTVEMPTQLGGVEKFDLTLHNFTPAGEATKQRWSGGGYHFDNNINDISENLWQSSPKGYPLSLKVKKIGT